MTALAKNTQRSKALHQLRLEAIPVAAGEIIYTGALVCRDATGHAVPAADTAGLVAAGVAHRGFDNSAGADGDIDNMLAPERYCEVDTNGPYSFAVSGTAPVGGEAAHAVDDNTVAVAATTTNDIVVGKFVEPDPANPGNWFVDVERAQGV